MFYCKGFIPELKGKRVKLRRLTEQDAEPLYRCWSDERTAQYLYLPPMNSASEVKATISLLNELSESEEAIRWGIELCSSGNLIGSCGYNSWQLQGAYRAEFGCELASPHWGNGYMREAASLVFEYGFQTMGLNRVEALTDIRNHRGEHFFRRIGFLHEGVLREYRHTDSGFKDVNVFSFLRRDFKNDCPSHD